MKKLKRLILSFLIIPFTLLICLLFLEIALRISTNPKTTPGYTLTHPLRRYELKPDFKGKSYNAILKINSYGIRDYERPISRGNSAYRICIFGDSITFGDGVNIEDTFSKVLERKLNKVCKKPVQVFNLGIRSYNTVHEYLYLKDSYLKFKPHLVIFEYTAANDTSLSEPPGSPKGVNKIFFVRWLKDLFRHLYSYHWLAARYYKLRYKILFRKHEKNELNARISHDELMYQEEFQGWIETKEAFHNIVKFCSNNKIVLIFAIFANNINLAPRLKDDPMKPIIDKVTTALEDAGVEHIILLDESFRKYAGNEKVLHIRPDDSHFSLLSHNLAGEELFRCIYENKFIK